MIYVLLKPERSGRRLSFICLAPFRPGRARRYDTAAEPWKWYIPEEDACTSLPVNRVFEIQWDSGYSQDLAEAREEYLENVSSAMPDVAAVMPNDPDPMDCL